MTSFLTRISCSRAQAEAALALEDPFAGADPPPVLVASETEEGWELRLYTEGAPSADMRALLGALAAGPAQTEALPDCDWVTLSQDGLAPVEAGRFRVAADARASKPGRIGLEIGPGLAFGTGQHATTRGCLLMLDRLCRHGRLGRVLDLGTGTAILAIAAARGDRRARVWASDIDPRAIRVARANARSNRAAGVRFAVASGLDIAQLRAAAPFDLVLANILAPPLLALAGALAQAIRPGGQLVLAGLLQSQRRAIEAAYCGQGFRLVARTAGEWPVLLLARRGGRARGPAAAVRAARRGNQAGLRSAESI
ncbi:50S ribosomal protein L11 methyltransferase [Thermaurantiacus sp.]